MLQMYCPNLLLRISLPWRTLQNVSKMVSKAFGFFLSVFLSAYVFYAGFTIRKKNFCVAVYLQPAAFSNLAYFGNSRSIRNLAKHYFDLFSRHFELLADVG